MLIKAFIEFLLEVLSHNPVELHEHLQNKSTEYRALYFKTKLNCGWRHLYCVWEKILILILNTYAVPDVDEIMKVNTMVIHTNPQDTDSSVHLWLCGLCSLCVVFKVLALGVLHTCIIWTQRLTIFLKKKIFVFIWRKSSGRAWNYINETEQWHQIIIER